jgi:hypothetical protein
MIDPMLRMAMPKGTIDGSYTSRACPDLARVHVVTDSDEFAVFELTAATRSDNARDRIAAGASRQALVDIGATVSRGPGAAVWRTAAVAARCDDFEVEYFRRWPIRMHAGAVDAEWALADAASSAFVRRVMWRLGPFGMRSPRWYKCVEGARQLRDRQRHALHRRIPRLRLKSVLRPTRIARDRVGKALRRTTRRLLRRMATQFR